MSPHLTALSVLTTGEHIKCENGWRRRRGVSVFPIWRTNAIAFVNINPLIPYIFNLLAQLCGKKAKYFAVSSLYHLFATLYGMPFDRKSHGDDAPELLSAKKKFAHLLT